MNHSQKPEEEIGKTAERSKSIKELSENELESVAGGVMFDGNGNRIGKKEPGKYYPAGVPTLSSDKESL